MVERGTVPVLRFILACNPEVSTVLCLAVRSRAAVGSRCAELPDEAFIVGSYEREATPVLQEFRFLHWQLPPWLVSFAPPRHRSRVESRSESLGKNLALTLGQRRPDRE